MNFLKLRKILSAGLSILFVMSSCKGKEEEKSEVVRPVKTTIVGGASELAKTSFPGITQELQSVDLAFRVGGPLVLLNATEGQPVKKGQLIAEVDSRDFKIDLMAKEARFLQARAEKERFKKTYERGSISKNEYEQKLAAYLEANSAYEAAKNALADTKLRAPFEAFIDQKMVENFERVHIGQTIVTLFDLSAIEVRMTIPEALAIQYRNYKDFTVFFDLYKDVPFMADLKEVEKKSQQSAGIPVILSLRHKNTPQSEHKIIPGLACKVKVNLKEDEVVDTEITEFMIPVSSVYAAPDSDQKFVFVVEKESMTVSRKEVKLGTLVSTNLIWLLSGLERGDILVTAGAKILQDGQKVKFLD